MKQLTTTHNRISVEELPADTTVPRYSRRIRIHRLRPPINKRSVWPPTEKRGIEGYVEESQLPEVGKTFGMYVATINLLESSLAWTSLPEIVQFVKYEGRYIYFSTKTNRYRLELLFKGN